MVVGLFGVTRYILDAVFHSFIHVFVSYFNIHFSPLGNDVGC